MGALQMCGCLSAVIRAVLIIKCLLTSVTGDGDDSEEIEIKYVLIGVGVGLFLSAGFIVAIICIIRKQIHDDGADNGARRPTEPHVLASSCLSQSQPPVAAVSGDMEMSEVRQ